MGTQQLLSDVWFIERVAEILACEARLAKVEAPLRDARANAMTALRCAFIRGNVCIEDYQRIAGAPSEDLLALRANYDDTIGAILREDKYRSFAKAALLKA